MLSAQFYPLNLFLDKHFTLLHCLCSESKYIMQISDYNDTLPL